MISEQRVISEGIELINQRIFKLDSLYQLNTLKIYLYYVVVCCAVYNISI